jgi:hypothetical protein
MGGGMPYQLEKGPYFSVTESMLNRSEADRVALLRLMYAGTDPNQLPTLNSTTLNSNPYPTAQSRRDHMNEHWFGRRPVRDGGWQTQDPFDQVQNPTTGFWHNWYGDAEGIVAQTFIRAVEVSLGLDHIEPADPATVVLIPTRYWPIEIFWRCPAPWVEGWVTWRTDDQATNPPSGHVTVHLHTPGHRGSALLLSPIRGAPSDRIPDYELEPVKSDADRGMWVIAHTEQRQHPIYGLTNPTPRGTPWQLPTFGPLVQSRGTIVTVQPNEPDGGVLATGRNYTP